MKKKKTNNNNSTMITINKRAYHEFFIEKEFEAGMILEGWEVKSLRANRVNINYCYILLKHNEAYLLGANFQPLTEASSHVICNSTRDRKLLLNNYELNSLHGDVNRKGYTILALSMYWKNSWVKLKIASARGKKLQDKRADIKNREWNINKSRIMKSFKHQ